MVIKLPIRSALKMKKKTGFQRAFIKKRKAFYMLALNLECIYEFLKKKFPSKRY